LSRHAVLLAALLLLPCRWAWADLSALTPEFGTLSEPQRLAADAHQQAQRRAIEAYVECLKGRYGRDDGLDASEATDGCAAERSAYARLLPEDLQASILEGVDAAVHGESAK
jgi:hypothetical protein